jgi:hypothetical protein
MPNVIYDAGTPGFNNGLPNGGGPLTQKGLLNAAFMVQDPRVRDISGRQKVSQHQNIYDADFEYGSQPLRWETYTYNTTYGQNSTNAANTATVTPLPGLGGVQMQVASVGDVVVRQSRPYHRYQPGKSLYMASNVNFGGPLAGQIQRVGPFDDCNGIAFIQGNPYTANPSGMYVMIRSDSQNPTGGIAVDTVIPYEQWNGDPSIKSVIDWTRVQMIWMEYGWYGAGGLRWGIIINSEPYILHQYGSGNGINQASGQPQLVPWSRTGCLPVRYEMRNTTASAPTTFKHFGVSVLIEGQIDKQRGYTYSYGQNLANPVVTVSASRTRYPLLSFRMRAMGQISYNQATTNGAVTSGTTTTLVASGAPFTSGTITPLSIVGNGTTAVITVPASSAMPAVGSTIAVASVTTSGFNNASAPVTAVTNNTISYANATSGTATIGSGTVTYTPSLVGRKLFYQPNVAGAAAGAATTVASATQASTNITGSVPAGTSTAPAVILTVTATSATIYPGMTLGTATNGGTFAVSPVIVSQLTGTTGGIGTYLLSVGNTGSAATYTTVATSGAYVTIQTTANHALTTNDVVTLSGFIPASGTINGIYPVLAVTANTFSINTGFGNVLGAITTTSGNIAAQYTAQITASTSTTITFQDIVNGLALAYAPTAGCLYSVGLIDRGQLLPQSLIITSTQNCYVELIASTPTAQVGLAGASFVPEANLGSLYSFAERDVTAGYLSGGEVVYAFTSSPSGLQTLDFSNFFPVLTNIKGNIPDILTIAITTTGTAAPISVNVICQEAMS